MADSNEIHNERSDPVKAGRATSRRTRHRPPSSTNGPLTTWRDLLAEGRPLVAELLGDQVAQRHVQLAASRNALCQHSQILCISHKCATSNLRHYAHLEKRC